MDSVEYERTALAAFLCSAYLYLKDQQLWDKWNPQVSDPSIIDYSEIR